MGRLHGPVVGGVVQVDQRVKFTKEVQSGLFYPWSNVLYADGDDGDDQYSGRGPSDSKETISAALGVMTDHDLLYLKAADYEESEALTLSLNDVQIIGVAPTQMQPHLDIWMEAAGGGFSPQIEVSGRGNYLANLCFRHGAEYTSGVGYAGDLTCMLISGRYNHFENVYFYSPIYNEQDVATTYAGVHITGHNNYFRGCKFGATRGRGEENFNLWIQGGIGNIFEDCIFDMVADSTSPFFVYLDSILRDMKFNLFKNCTFYAHSGNFSVTPADAIKTNNWAGAATASIIFDSRCNFVNVSQVSDTDNDYSIWKPQLRGEYGAQTEKLTLIAQRNQGA